MNKIMKKTAAGALSLVLLGGVVQIAPAKLALTEPALTAEAAEGSTVAFSEEDETLVLLKGEIDFDDVREWGSDPDVKHVVAQKGAVLPEDCSALFDNFKYTETIDLSKADTSNVVNMEEMFYACEALKELDLSGIDTSNVYNMYEMFCHCQSLEKLDLSSLDTSNVIDMSQMFYGCKSLQTLDLSSFDTSNVTDMSDMFSQCDGLQTLDLSSFDTSNVTNMSSMFYFCSSLTSLDLYTFSTSSVTTTTQMFFYCDNLETIMVSPGWNMKKVTDSYRMFSACKKLVGENGTIYDANHTDVEYARIDREDTPGYLTPSTRLFAVVKGASISLDGNIGINFYLDTWGNDVACAFMYDMNGSEPVESYLNPESQKVEEGAYKGCFKFSYGVNAIQTDRKIFLEALGHTRNTDGTVSADTTKFLLFDTSGNRLEKDRFGFSVQDYLDRYIYEVNEDRDNLVYALDNYCKAARNYFLEEENETDVYEYPVTAFKWDLFNLNGRKMSLVLTSETSVRIYDKTDAIEATNNMTGETLGKENGYFEIKNIPAHYLIEFPYQISINGEKVTFHPINYGYLALTTTNDTKLHTLVNALYSYGYYAQKYYEVTHTA